MGSKWGFRSRKCVRGRLLASSRRFTRLKMPKVPAPASECPSLLFAAPSARLSCKAVICLRPLGFSGATKNLFQLQTNPCHEICRVDVPIAKTMVQNRQTGQILLVQTSIYWEAYACRHLLSDRHPSFLDRVK